MQVTPFILAALLLPLSAAAEPTQVAVVGFGRCDRALLVDAARSLRTEVSSRAGEKVMSEEQMRALLGFAPTLSPEEIRRAIESAKTDFAALNLDRSEETLRGVLADIDRLPPGKQRWAAYTSARAYLARVLQYRKDRRALGVWLDVLRVEEDYALDRAEFPPSTRELLEQARVELHKLPRYPLEVDGDVPGAQVFLNGREVGKTPFSRELPSGTYEVVVGEPSRHAFVRLGTLSRPTQVHVNLATESALRAGGLCFESDDGRDAQLAKAPQLAAALQVERLIVAGLERLPDGEYVTAALVDVHRGQEVRAGRERIAGETLPPLGKLAELVLTGKKMEEAPPEPVAASARVPVEEKPPEPAFVPRAPVAAPVEAQGLSGGRIAAFAATGAAVVLGGLAAWRATQVSGMQDELDRLAPGGAPRAEDATRVKELEASIASTTTQRNIFGGAALGAAAGAGVLFFVSAGPSQSPGERSASLMLALAGTF